MISQYRSRFGDVLEKVILSLYGLPHLAVGVSILFITVKIFPSIYQSFFALVISYLIVFLPQAIGGGQASMEQVKGSYIDASSSLGKSKFETFRKVTFPLIYRGLFAGGALVFLSTMKELPQTLLLRPTGFNTMAVDVWSFASEGLFTQAAFSAFILLAISAIPTYILSTRNLNRIKMVFDNLIIRARSLRKVLWTRSCINRFQFRCLERINIWDSRCFRFRKNNSLKTIAGFENPDSGIIEMHDKTVFE